MLLLIGLAQGIIISILLLLSKKNTFSNKFLACAILSFCLLCVKMLLHSLKLRVDPTLRYLPIGVELLIAPVMYFYIVSLITPAFRFKWNALLHFIPFLLSQGYSFYVFFATSNIHTVVEQDVIASSLHFDLIKNTEDYLVLFSIAGYAFAGFFKIKTYRNWLNNTVSDTAYPSFTWLNNILKLSLLLGVFLLLNLFADYFFDLKATTMTHWQVYYIFIASLIYYLGFAGYIQPQYRHQVVITPERKNRVERLSADASNEILLALERALAVDKVFLNPTLSAKDLAKILRISQSNLSYIINHSFKRNFRDLINDYRVEEAKLKLNDSTLKHMSILGIALESGFNSEASFYRIFRKNTGLSPNEYINKP